MNWNKRYRLAALADNYTELLHKFAAETIFSDRNDPRRQAWNAYTSVPLKDGTIGDWTDLDKIDTSKLDHEGLIKVCDEWSKKLTQAAGKDERMGKSYFRPVANHLAEIKDWHTTQFQPQLGEGIFEPPTHREQNTRKRRKQ